MLREPGLVHVLRRPRPSDAGGRVKRSEALRGPCDLGFGPRCSSRLRANTRARCSRVGRPAWPRASGWRARRSGVPGIEAPMAVVPRIEFLRRRYTCGGCFGCFRSGSFRSGGRGPSGGGLGWATLDGRFVVESRALVLDSTENSSRILTNGRVLIRTELARMCRNKLVRMPWEVANTRTAGDGG